MFVISFYENIDLVGPAKECIVESQQPLGRVKHYKKVQTIHDLQKENPTKEAPFEALSARKSSPIVGSGRTLFMLLFNSLYYVLCLFL